MDLALCLAELAAFCLVLAGIGLLADYLEANEDAIRRRYE